MKKIVITGGAGFIGYSIKSIVLKPTKRFSTSIALVDMLIMMGQKLLDKPQAA